MPSTTSTKVKSKAKTGKKGRKVLTEAEQASRDAARAAAKAARTDLLAQVEEFEAAAENEEIDPRLLAQVEKFATKYSWRNSCLIVMQDENATDVAGFKAWLDRGRVVRKGQHGIKILAPAGKTAGTEGKPATDTTPAVEGEEGRQLYKLTTVFDIAQTDELPAKDTTAADTAN